MQPAQRIAALITFALLTTAPYAIAATSYPQYPKCTQDEGYLHGKLQPNTDFHYAVPCKTGNNPLQITNFKELNQVCKEIQIPSACIFGSLEKGERSPKYGKCEGGGLVTGSAPRPCLNNELHLFTYMAYTEAMHCLKLDAKELFPLINHESHFYLNVRSSTGAWGVGQLTGVAIDQVNKTHELKEAREEKSCEPLRGLLNKPMNASQPCSRFNPPENPAKNFLYAGALYLMLKKQAHQLINSAPGIFKDFPKDKRDRAAMELARMMYNGGMGGIAQVFSVYKKEMHGRKVSYADFRNQFPKYIRTYYGGALTPVSHERRNEVAEYIDKIQNETMSLEDDMKVRCSTTS